MPAPPDQTSFPAVERRSAELLRELGQSDGDSATAARQIVTIQGDDILLPEASPELGATQEQSYYFDVVAEDPDGRSMRDLLESGSLRIETIGTDATLVEPAARTTTPEMGAARQPTINTGKARLKVVATKDGKLQPFTIHAWYPSKTGTADTDAWSATRRVQVFYGDIRTRVQIVSRTEAEGMFGKTFSEHFYVGRVFLRNRSTSKSLAVYTTSMRVPVLIYRRTELPGGLDPVSAERLDRLAEEEWETKYHPNPPLPSLGTEADKVVKRFLDEKWYRGALRYPYASTEAPRPFFHSQAERDALAARVLAVWARKSADDRTAKRDEEKLTRREQEQLLDEALSKDPLPSAQERDAEAETLATSKLQDRPAARTTPAGRDLILRAWALRDRYLQQATEQAKDADSRIEALEKDLRFIPKNAPEKQRLLYSHICTVLTALAAPASAPKPDTLQVITALDAYLAREEKIAGETRASFERKISEVADDQARADFRHAALVLPQYVRQMIEAKALRDFLSAPRPPEELAKAAPSVRAAITELRERALGQAESGPASGQARLAVNLDAQPLALSPDPYRQRRLVEGGYVWRDSYRPMTFQAVLNSVMFAHARDPKTVTVKVLEALATVAGGAVGLVDKPSTDLLRSANFFSSVFVPTLRATLVEDLNKHITNLGDMAMDTVILIPPNDSVDRYVFFPRDAIYNFPDEFDPVSPGYIRGVEGKELFVEAALVDTGQVVRGGSAASSDALVARALNEGERSEAARLLSIAETQAKLRTVELGNLNARIDAVMAAAKTDSESLAPEQKEAKLESARAAARQMLAQFTAYFGPDQSGVIAATLAKHGIATQDAPPVALPGTLLRLPRGTTSVPWPLHVTDPDTPLKSLTFDKKADGAVDDWFDGFTAPKPSGSAPLATVFKTKTEKVAPAAEAARKMLDLTVKDLGGNVATFTQPVELLPPRIDPPVLTEEDKGPVTLVEKPDPGKADAKDTAKDAKADATPPIKTYGTTSDAALARGTATLALTAPLHDADTSLYKLIAAKSSSGYIASTKSTADAAACTLGLLVRLDTSEVKETGTKVEFTVYLVPATTTATDDAGLAQAALTRIAVHLTVDPTPQKTP
jgi:hypothetical protein